MSTNVRTVGLLLLLSVLPQAVRGQAKPLEMKWNELAPLIGGQRVEIVLNDGVKVKGEVIAVREEAILLDVSSAVKGYGRGSGTVPRGSFAQINLERRRGAWGRTLGTVLGVLTGLTLGGYAAAHTDSAAAGIPTFLGVSAAISAGGYYTGRLLDRRITRIQIVP